MEGEQAEKYGPVVDEWKRRVREVPGWEEDRSEVPIPKGVELWCWMADYTWARYFELDGLIFASPRTQIGVQAFQAKSHLNRFIGAVEDLDQSEVLAERLCYLGCEALMDAHPAQGWEISVRAMSGRQNHAFATSKSMTQEVEVWCKVRRTIGFEVGEAALTVGVRTPIHTVCLAVGTEIATLRGDRAIETVKAGDWVYSWDGTRYTPTRVKTCMQTGTRPTMAIQVSWLDRFGKRTRTVRCTPDHRFMQRDGQWIEASRLKPGDPLMPFFRQKAAHGYHAVMPYNDGRWILEHRYVTGTHDPEVTVHHRDEDRLHNYPENLQPMPRADHISLHHRGSQTGRKAMATVAADPDGYLEFCRATAEGVQAWWNNASDEERILRGEASRKGQLANSTFEERSERGRKAIQARKDQGWNHTVEAVEDGLILDVWDLEVEHPSHSVALSAGVTVHNCPFMIFEADGHSHTQRTYLTMQATTNVYSAHEASAAFSPKIWLDELNIRATPSQSRMKIPDEAIHVLRAYTTPTYTEFGALQGLAIMKDTAMRAMPLRRVTKLYANVRSLESIFANDIMSDAREVFQP